MGLGRALGTVVAEAEELVASFDPAVVAPAEAVGLLSEATRLRNLASALCTKLSVRAAESGQWRRDGARTEAEWVARRLGTSDAEARSTIDTGRALAELPATDSAFRAGRLSPQQAATVADAAVADPSSEARMLRLAARDHLAGLRKERDRVKAAADPDADARYRRIHRERHVRVWTDADGAGRGSWSTTADRQAVILAALDRLSADAAKAAHERGEHEPAPAYAADALAAMASAVLAGVGGGGGGGGGVDGRGGVAGRGSCAGRGARTLPPKAIVRIDHTALVRGHAAPGETSEIAGVGPVPVSLVRELMDAGDLFLTAVVTKGVDVATVAHLGRRTTAFQTTALQWRDPVCRVEGCTRPSAEWDHHEDWAKTHETRLWDLGGLCAHDHHLKTYRGYRIAPSDLPGKIRLVPPDDP